MKLSKNYNNHKEIDLNQWKSYSKFKNLNNKCNRSYV